MRRAGMMKRWAQYGGAALVVAAVTVALRFVPLPGDGPVSRLGRDALLSVPLLLASPDDSVPDESEEETSEAREPNTLATNTTAMKTTATNTTPTSTTA